MIIYVSSDADIKYPHVGQPSNITCMYSTLQHEICIIDSPSPMKSTSFTFINDTELYDLSSSLAKKLVKAPLDSIHGIPIVAQQTRLKWVGLNVTRPAVLQIEYGMNVSSCNGHTMRNTYGYGLSTLNINDPRK